MRLPRLRNSVSLTALLSAGALVFAGAAVGGQRAADAGTTLGPAHAYAPPAHQVLTGASTLPLAPYTSYVHKHPAVYQEFVAWGQYVPAITGDAVKQRSRMMMMIGTKFGSRNVITPLGIATGKGDAWLIALGHQIAASHNITYIRLMAEMNNSVNPYCAFNANGSSRGRAYSTAAFRQAWRRVALILRGGPVGSIDARLRSLHLPRLRTRAGALAEGKVAMVWVPMVAGDPDIAANEPRAYFPGRAWVDWVGTDFYSRYPNFSGLTAFYNAYRGYPFTFGEYAFWDSGSVGWVDGLFNWIDHRSAVRMVVYNDASPDFQLSHYPAGAAALHRQLAGPRFLAFAPEWRGR